MKNGHSLRMTPELVKAREEKLSGWHVGSTETRIAKRPRKPSKPRARERDVLKACLQLLAAHPSMWFSYRQNTGGMKNANGLYVKFGFRGQADIIGMLRDGRFFACEVKRPGCFPSAEQHAFLAKINEGGGVGVWCDSTDRLAQLLNDTSLR